MTEEDIDDALDEIADDLGDELTAEFGAGTQFILVVFTEDGTQFVTNADPDEVSDELRRIADMHDLAEASDPSHPVH